MSRTRRAPYRRRRSRRGSRITGQKILLYASIIIMTITLGWWYSTVQEDPSVDIPSTQPTETTASSGGWQELGGKLCFILPDGSPASGWTEIDGGLHYLDSDGAPLPGWNTVDGKTYYFLEDGAPATGWLHIEDKRYYLKEDGTPASGWTEIDGQRCWFYEDGTPRTGWAELDGNRYYLNINGAPLTGTHEIDGETYYFDPDGTFYNGWITAGHNQYYCLDDGSFATGKTVIDGKTYYFSPGGIYVPLVNPWLALPDDHQTDLLPLYDGYFVEVVCYEALKQMLSDCEAAGFEPYVCSAYRTQADQEYLFERKVRYYMEEEEYDREDAEKLAATVVAIPGTSEHQLGLAVDIVDLDFTDLTDEQADTDTQQWLMEHCWEYGFILRYPKGSTDITGIIWEPWHYRYVGTEVAAEVYAMGVTLEEYLGFTHD